MTGMYKPDLMQRICDLDEDVSLIFTKDTRFQVVEDRLELIWSGKSIDYYTPSLEDIVISKLCAGRPEDINDMIEVADHINWEKLEHLAKADGELRANILSDNSYFNFLGNFEEFEKRYRPCRN